MTPEEEAAAKEAEEAAAKLEADAVAAAEAAEEAAKEMVEIITTDRGSFGPEGISPVGTKRTIHFRLFSANWMKPASLGQAAKLKKLMKIGA